MISGGQIPFEESNKRDKSSENQRKMIATLFDSNIVAVEFEMDIYNLRDTVIELNMIQLEDAKYRKIIHNLI